MTNDIEVTVGQSADYFTSDRTRLKFSARAAREFLDDEEAFANWMHHIMLPRLDEQIAEQGYVLDDDSYYELMLTVKVKRPWNVRGPSPDLVLHNDVESGNET